MTLKLLILPSSNDSCGLRRKRLHRVSAWNVERKKKTKTKQNKTKTKQKKKELPPTLAQSIGRKTLPSALVQRKPYGNACYAGYVSCCYSVSMDIYLTPNVDCISVASPDTKNIVLSTSLMASVLLAIHRGPLRMKGMGNEPPTIVK